MAAMDSSTSPGSQRRRRLPEGGDSSRVVAGEPDSATTAQPRCEPTPPPSACSVANRTSRPKPLFCAAGKRRTPVKPNPARPKPFDGNRNLLHRAVDVPILENMSFLSCQTRKLCGLTIKCCSSNVPDKFLPVNLGLKSIVTFELEGSLQEFDKEFTKLGFQLNVEYLKLSCFSYKSDVTSSALVRLLRLCPKLCKLEINLSQLEVVTFDCVDAWLKLLERLHSATRTNKMLQALKVTSFTGSKIELLFIAKLLASFSTLKKVVIVHKY